MILIKDYNLQHYDQTSMSERKLILTPLKYQKTVNVSEISSPFIASEHFDSIYIL